MLKSINIKGLRSIKDQTVEFGDLNVFIGGNAAGKSNFIKTFAFLRAISVQRLQQYVGRCGGAGKLLYYGSKQTKEISVITDFCSNSDFINRYRFSLVPTIEDYLVFRKEYVGFCDTKKFDTFYNAASWKDHTETKLTDSTDKVAMHIKKHIQNYRVYHFHDTSDTARVKQTCDINDNDYLRPQADNLAAFLYYLKERHPDHFEMIQDLIRQIIPFFNQFILKPTNLNPDKIRLRWEEIGSDNYFDISSLSDGTVRFICVATVLLQPKPPALILIDEPELGLHPAAIQLLANMLISSSKKTQIIVSTQSVTLINHLSPEHIVVVDREEQSSVFKRLSSEKLNAWVDDFALGELWEKNVFGGRP